MKKSFFLGLVTLLPVIVTYVVMAFGISLVTKPFEVAVNSFINSTHLFDNGLGVITRDQVTYLVSKALIVAALVVFVFLVGFLAARVLLESCGDYVDRVLRKIPIIRNIYSPSKELVDVFFKPHEKQTSRDAVLVPYPTADQLTVGIITAEFEAKLSDHETEAKQYVSVFIPSTPNATNGYLCTFLKSDVSTFDVPADEALKYVMSFGSAKAIAVKE